MKNQCSTQQLSFNFEFEQVSTAPVEVKKEIIVQQQAMDEEQQDDSCFLEYQPEGQFVRGH